MGVCVGGIMVNVNGFKTSHMTRSVERRFEPFKGRDISVITIAALAYTRALHCGCLGPRHTDTPQQWCKPMDNKGFNP